jgi:hypothetical protein
MEMNDLIKEAIWDAKIYRFSVYEDDAGHLSIDVFLESQRPDHPKYLKLLFKDVKEYAFSWTGKYYFYYIGSYKYLRHNSLYYMSFDPDNEDDAISENDGDFILCSKVDVCINDAKF